jgi:hypothetical protein
LDFRTRGIIKNMIEAYGGGVSVKVGTITRDMAAARGDVSYTGVGFQPSLVIFTAAVQTTSISFGFGDASASGYTKGFNTGAAILFSGGSGSCLALHEDANKSQHAVVKTLDADGFTLTWTNAASPAEAVITIAYAAVG